MPHSDLQAFDDVGLMRAILIGEADQEPFLGKLAIACVVRNRVRDKRWPATWKDVMLQPHQFSCTMPEFFREDMVKTRRGEMWWRECQFAAWGAVNNYFKDISAGANHYFNPLIVPEPKWAKGQKPCFKIGNHHFYRL